MRFQAFEITDPYSSPFCAADWLHFLEIHLRKQSTFFPANRFCFKPRMTHRPKDEARTPADHCRLPTYKHGVKTRKNLHMPESETD